MHKHQIQNFQRNCPLNIASNKITHTPGHASTVNPSDLLITTFKYQKKKKRKRNGQK